MGQIVGINSDIFRCNISAIQTGGSKANVVLAADEVWLISTANSLTSSGSGDCDAYIIGNGTTAASELELKNNIPLGSTRNLFNDVYLKKITGVTYADGVLIGTAANIATGFNIPIQGTENGHYYTFQFEARVVTQKVTTGANLLQRFNYADGTTNVAPVYTGDASGFSISNSSTEWVTYSGVSNGKEIKSLSFYLSSGGANVLEMRNFMLIEGYNIMPFVPYRSFVDSVARNEIERIGKDVLLMSAEKKSVKDCTKLANTYIKYTDGSHQSSSSYTSYSFDNTEFKANYIKVKIADSNYAQASVAYYDANGNYMQSASIQGVNNPSREIFAEVPTDAAEIIICNRAVLLAEPTIEIYSLTPSSEEDVGVQTLHDIDKYFKDMSFDKVFTLNDTSLYKSNGSARTHSGYKCSDYIEVFEGDKFDYSLFFENTGIGGLCFYDEAKDFQSAVVTHTEGSAGLKTGNWTAPSKGFIRVCTYYTGNTSLYLRYYGIEKTIPRSIAIINNVLPDYWEDYLKAKEQEINSALRSVGTHGDSLIFFSDYHILLNTGYTPTIVRRLQEKYRIRQVVFGGDAMNTESNDEMLMQRLEQYVVAFRGVDVVNIIGNHDYNPYGSLADFGVVYPLLQKNLEHDYQCKNNSMDGYFFRDNEQQKIRYIYLNTRTNGISASDTEQLDWFKTTLNSVGEGWYVVVFAHLVFEWYNSDGTYSVNLSASGGIIKDICDGYQNKIQGTGSGVSFDFTAATGNMACVLCGHTHIDHSVISEAGYPIIAIDRDAIDYPPVGTPSSTRTKGTASEQVIDLVCINTQNKTIDCVRIGGGANRSFTF